MATIEKLHKNGETIYPQTKAEAVLDEDNTSMQTRINEGVFFRDPEEAHSSAYVDTNSIVDGAVTSAKLANSSVTSAKLANSSVTTAKLANNSVTKDKIDLSTLPFCCASVTGTADTYISSSSGWAEANYTNFNSSKFITSNSSVFSYSSGGIKVAVAGFYVVSGMVNIDCAEGKSALLRVNSTTKFIADDHKSGDMTGMSLPAMVIKLSANDVVHIGYRISTTSSYLSRGGRSQLSIVRIA